jgi:adenine-specific DNA methylase
MSEVNLFEVATRENYLFPFKGMINVIDLWNLSLTNLDSVFKTLNAEVKKSEEESLLNAKTKEDEELTNKIEIIKYIVNKKLAEKEARENEKKNKEKRQRILEIKAKRQDEALENMSDEDLDKLLADLN